MKTANHHQSKFLILILFFSFVFFFDSPAIRAKNADDKIKTEDLINKHLDSIGTKEARMAVSSIMAVGKSKAVSRGRSAGETTGIVVIASTGKKNLIGMKFDNNDYPFEKMGYDGDEFSVGFVQPGQRTTLGAFLLTNKKTFRVGILGGVLSTGWELLNYDPKIGKLKCGGTKKINDVNLYKCSYDPKKGSELDISLFFDSESFQHVRTEYRRVISGGQGISVDQSARQSEVRYLFTEDFANFKETNGLTLPHDYTISYERTGGGGGSDMEWRMEFSQFAFNTEIDDKDFKVDEY